MEEYVTDFAKMALALTSTQLAKETAVKEHGIGEEINVHFMGWNEEDLVVIAQMNDAVAKTGPDERFERSKILCELLRKNWGVESLTMVSEGYCSLDSSKTENCNLATAFASSSLPVFECITVTHVTIDIYGTASPVSMVAAPYVVKIGRNVEWLEVLAYPEVTSKNLKQYKYPLMLTRAIMENPAEDSYPETMNQARASAEELGFILQELF